MKSLPGLYSSSSFFGCLPAPPPTPPFRLLRSLKTSLNALNALSALVCDQLVASPTACAALYQLLSLLLHVLLWFWLTPRALALAALLLARPMLAPLIVACAPPGVLAPPCWYAKIGLMPAFSCLLQLADKLYRSFVFATLWLWLPLRCCRPSPRCCLSGYIHPE